MSKLFKLKSWLTIPEAAQYLSKIIAEDVSETDIYRLCLDGHIKLAVNILGSVPAKLAKIVPLHEAKTRESYLDSDGKLHYLVHEKEGRILSFDLLDGENDITDSADPVDIPIGYRTPNNKMFQVEEGEINRISGVFNLTMIGNERIKIEELCMQSVGGDDLDLICIDGTFVETADGENGFQLQEMFDSKTIKKFREKKKDDISYIATRDPENYYPAGMLPVDSFIVVQREELSRFIDSLDEEKSEKPLSTKERKSLHLIITALIELAEYDIEQPYAAAKEIMYKIKESSHIAENTIVTHIKAARETAINL